MHFRFVFLKCKGVGPDRITFGGATFCESPFLSSDGCDKCEKADKCEPKNGIFGPFEHIFWFKFLIFGRSPPTPNFNGFTTKIPENACLRRARLRKKFAYSSPSN